MNSKKKTTYRPDTFDLGFLKVVHELQSKGHCKNISRVEEYLQLPKRTLLLVLNGDRGIPLLHRSVIQKFFAERYDVNVKVFTNQTVYPFNHEVPLLKEDAEDYQTAQSNRLTTGDAVHLQKLQLENAALKEQLKLLQSQLNQQPQLDQLTKKLKQLESKMAQISGPKTGQTKRKK